MCLPRGELERSCDQDNHADREWYGAGQRWLSHLEGYQSDAQRKSYQSESAPDQEVTRTNQRGQPT